MDIRFLHDINKNYMVLTFEKNENENYRLKMIRNKEIPGLLNLKQKFTDSNEKLYYDISSMQSLEVLYEKKHMESEELKKIIFGLENCVNSLKGYLLDFNEIILNPKMVFVDIKNLSYSFCYCPYNKGDFRKELREYMNFVITKIDHGDLETLNLAYELQKITCQENYVIGDLTTLIREPIIEPEYIFEEEISIPHSVISEMPIKEGYLNKGIIGAFIMGILVWIFVYIKTDSPLIRKIIPLIVSAVLIYAGYIYLKSRKKERVPVLPTVEIENQEDEEIEIDEDSHTVFLGNSDYSSTRFLKNTEKPERDIRLESLPLIIGKIKERADIVIEENSVSRIHARLTQEKDVFYIEDLNSTNGTFINGKRLTPYEQERLNTGDIVGISEIHYKFV